MNLADFTLDLVHYGTKICPSTTTFALGATLRKDNAPPEHEPLIEKSTSLPPTTRRLIRDFVSVDGYKTDLPLFRPCGDARGALLQDAWKTVLGINGAPCSPLGMGNAGGETYSSDVCVSTVEHDNSQLVWGRDKRIPVCDYGEECEALSLAGNQGPLQAYLTPTQQQAFEESGKLCEGPHFCLLCIRRDTHAVHLAYSAFLSSPDVQLERKVFVIPPFQNLRDQAGGYHSWAMLPEATFMPIKASVAGVSGTLSVKYNPQTTHFYVDQGKMVYGADFHRRSSQPHGFISTDCCA